MIRVLVADDEALVRGGISMILEAQPDMEVVGQAETAPRRSGRCRELAPDVVLMDVRMPGVDATLAIVAVGMSVRVLILTTFGDDEYLYETMRAGASGFLLNSLPPEQLAISCGPWPPANAYSLPASPGGSSSASSAARLPVGQFLARWPNSRSGRWRS